MTRVGMWVTALCLAGAAQAGWEGNLTATTDYINRGWSQSRELPALQAGLDGWLENGCTLGVWASQVRFPGDPATWETDIMLGWSRSLGALELELDAQHIMYPGCPESDYTEFVLNAALEPLELELLGSPDYAACGSAGGYLGMTGTKALREFLELHAGLGCTWYSRAAAEDLLGDRQARLNLDWQLGTTLTHAPFTASLTYHDTDQRSATLADGLAGRRVILAVGVSYGRE
jgi:uncharacterized protein (TIGR02001 family)